MAGPNGMPIDFSGECGTMGRKGGLGMEKQTYSDVFCKVYNEFGWNYYPEVFGQQLLQWLQRHPLQPKTALDLACGTGILCQILHHHGIEASGMDFSEGMIAIARQGNRDIHYDVADMTTYRPEKQFDLVTCTGDAVNHIGSLADVEKIFQNVFAYLRPGGYFVFDLLNEHEISDSEPFEMAWQDKQIWFQMTRPAADRVRLTIRVYQGNALEFEENIHETIHDPAVICRMLETAGFAVVRCADSLLDDGSHGTTWFVVAQKR